MPLDLPKPPADKGADHWQYRAIKFLKGNQTREGAFLIAVLQRASYHNPPRFSHKGYITREGMVVAVNYQDAKRDFHPHMPVATVESLVHTFREVAQRCEMTNAEAHEMFAEIRRWITKDYRVQDHTLKELGL